MLSLEITLKNPNKRQMVSLRKTNKQIACYNKNKKLKENRNTVLEKGEGRGYTAHKSE